jgi:hypothetical protein
MLPPYITTDLKRLPPTLLNQFNGARADSVSWYFAGLLSN